MRCRPPRPGPHHDANETVRSWKLTFGEIEIGILMEMSTAAVLSACLRS
jgi:hypothetical protein